MPNIAYTRPEVTVRLPEWSLIRDCLGGEKIVKDQRTKYLPMPNKKDKSKENRDRYDAYLCRAVFYNVMGHTQEGLIGQVFAVDPVVDLPPTMDLLKEDVDGGGVTLVQQAKKTANEVLAYGRAGLLTDYPIVPEGEAASEADLRAGRIRPTVTQWSPFSIINWRTRFIGGELKLSLVVLSDQYIIEDDGFELSFDDQWRVLRLDEENLYVSEVWRRAETDGDFVRVEELSGMPRDATGARLDYIPFTFVGPLNNDSTLDRAPMYDLASLNIAHYRNSADYEDACYLVGQPTPVFTGLTQQWVDDVLKGGVQLGSRVAVPLPTGANATMLQANPNPLVKEAMDQKEKQMVALGARLVEQRQVSRTLGEAQQEYAVETCVLANVARNTGAAYTQALKWAAEFMGADPAAVKVQLSTDFAIVRMTALERQELIKEWQANALTFSEMRTQLRQSGIATLDDDQAREEIDADAARFAAALPAGAPGQQPPAGSGGAA